MRSFILGMGAGVCVLAFWMASRPDTPTTLQAQQLAKPVAPPVTRLQAESNLTISHALSENLSSRDLLQEVLAGSRLSPLWLESHGFATRSEALERLHGLMNGYKGLTAPGITHIAFGPQGGSSDFAASEPRVLATQERYVQAVMPRPDGGLGDSVLLRWRNASDNTVIELSAQAIQPNVHGAIPIWMYSANDWPPGRYRVEVISPDPSLKLLAAGDFEIAGSNARLTPFSFVATNTSPD